MADVASLIDAHHLPALDRAQAAALAEMAPHIHLVPVHLRGGLLRYLLFGVKPGNFLCAVINNDLFQAISRADEASLAGLRDLVRFLYGYAPGGSWGAADRVEAWVSRCGIAAREAA